MLRGCAAAALLLPLLLAAGQTIIILLRLKICEHKYQIHIYLNVYIFIHMYIFHVLYIIINTATHGFNCFSVEDLRRIVGYFVLFCGCHLTKVLNLSGLGRDT